MRRPKVGLVNNDNIGQSQVAGKTLSGYKEVAIRCQSPGYAKSVSLAKIYSCVALGYRIYGFIQWNKREI
jgi:hypothetical protein